MILLVTKKAPGRAAAMASKWLQMMLSLVFTDVGVQGGGRGTGLKESRYLTVILSEPLEALVPSLAPTLQSLP